MKTPSASSASLRRARLALPLFLAGVLIACIGLALRGITPRSATAASVRDLVAQTVSGGGTVGPFFLAAEAHDPETGTFTNFHAETDDLLVAARRAVLHVNAATDTIQFELFEATILKIPDDGSVSPLMSKERHILGPFAWEIDIVEEE